MKGFSLLTVGQTLHDVVLLQHVPLYVVGEEKQKGHYCEKQSSQYGVKIILFHVFVGGEILFLVNLDVDLAIHALLERDECLGLGYACDMLYAVVEQFHEMLVVLGEYLDQH